jgi:hypothetical protein
MQGSRTIKTLAVLLVCMTVGALALMLLDRAPISLPAYMLAAEGPQQQADDCESLVLYPKQVPLQPGKWRNVIVLNSTAFADAEAASHFVVAADGTITPGQLWARQADGRHTPRFSYNETGVGICLAGQFAQQRPSDAQLQSLVRLVQTIQYEMQIPAGNVHLRASLVDGDDSPGRAFPARWFRDQLLRPRR